MYGLCCLHLNKSSASAVTVLSVKHWSTSNKLLFQRGTFSPLTSTRLLCPRLTARCRGDSRAMLRMLGSAPRSRRALQLSALFFSTAQCKGTFPCSSQLFNSRMEYNNTCRFTHIQMHLRKDAYMHSQLL